MGCGKIVSMRLVWPEGSPPSGVLLGMSEEIAFLLDAAEQLREIALTETEIAADLRRWRRI
jgi:hypothetical protein